MAVYKIFKGTDQINRIVASEEFVKEYYSQDGYSYELEPDPKPEPEPADEPVTWSALAASIKEGVNEV